MRHSYIAAFLSLTLLFNSLVPIQYAIAEPVEDETGSEAVDQEFLEPVDDVLLEEGDTLDDGVVSDVDSGLVDGISDGELSESEVISPEQPSTYAVTRAVPVAAVIDFLLQAGITSAVGEAVSKAVNSSSSDKTFAVQYGILNALCGDGFSYVAHIYMIVRDLEDDVLSISSATGQINTILKRIEPYLVHTVDGNTYDAPNILWRIRNESIESSDSLADVAKRLVYTDSDGVGYNAASMLFGIRRQVLTYSPLLQEHLPMITEVANRLYYTPDGYTARFSLGNIMWRVRTESINHTTLLTSIETLLKDLEIEVPDIKVPDVNVEVNPLNDALGSADLSEELFGTLDTVALGAELVTLTSLIEKAFPFCLVFGLVAIIELLVAPADAPSFDFPLPDGSGGTFLYTVDLEAFDPAAGVFRAMITIVYIIGLIRITSAFIYRGGGE